MSVENIGPCGCCGGDGCEECIDRSTLSIDYNGNTGTLTEDVPPDSPHDKAWQGSVSGCLFYLGCRNVLGEIVYTLFAGTFVCVEQYEVVMDIVSCNPLELEATIPPGECCAAGTVVITL